MKILIIDSGVTMHPVFDGIPIYTTGYNGQKKLSDINDENGHGTAITYLVTKDIKNVDVYVMKLFNEENECEIENLILALEYIAERNVYDVINMSFGIVATENNNQIVRLENVCNILREQGSLLLAAYDNDGAISYPAFFNGVLGIDISKKAHKRSEFEYVSDSCVNVLGYGCAQRVAWSNPEYTIVEGTSFACANVSNIVIKALQAEVLKESIKEFLKSKAIATYSFEKTISTHTIPQWLKNANAIVLPVSKEIHSIIAFESILEFNIVDVYDVKYKGLVGKNVRDLLCYRDIKDRKIKNYEDIPWQSNTFDSVILGHMDELSSVLKKDIRAEIIDLCIKYNKKLFAFDDLSTYDCVHDEVGDLKSDFYFPIITNKNIPKGYFGKLHSINIPVMAIIGTSSSQGKFTLQLALREKMMKTGYKVGQIASEPSAFCFGMDFVYPYGYRSTTYTGGFENILLINHMMHEIEKKEYDLCIIGTQSNTAFYDYSNLENIPLHQMDVLYGAMPDCFILVVNVYDDLDYIIRTLRGTEQMFCSKCLAIVIYPITKKNLIGTLYTKKDISNTNEYMVFKTSVAEATGICVFDMKEASETMKLVDRVIEFFSVI